MTKTTTEDAVRIAVAKLTALKAAHEWRPSGDDGEEDRDDPRSIHSQSVGAGVLLMATAASRGIQSGVAYVVGGAHTHVEITLPLLPDLPAADLLAVLRWLAVTYGPVAIGIAATVAGPVPLKLAVLPEASPHGDEIVPGLVVVTAWGCANHGQHTMTTVIATDGEHQFDTPLLGGGDPYLTAVLGAVFAKETK